MAKADHMLSILWLLKTRKKMSASQLADELEIHIRTVYRYIDALCASGVPIISDTGRTGGYQLPEHFVESPLFFDIKEQKALVHAAIFAQEAGYPHGAALNRAVSKIKRFTNPAQLNTIERHESGIEVLHPPVHILETAALQHLEASIAAGLTLSVVYQTGYEGNSQERLIDPYGLVYWKGKWYIVGFCHLRHEIRTFRVDRMKSLTETDSIFQKPEAFSSRQFLLDSLLPNTEDEASLISIHIEGNPQAINDLCQHWLLGHALIERTAYKAHFKLDEWTLYTQAPYLLLSYGGKLFVTQPQELRECMAEIALSLYEYYQSPQQ
ncbi:helix-turn-helix transcriptional regulator [Paenibacillus eucommiae]|uniref:DNA-binding transcriptional regulator YafY n=1 Tax=Paenibacillus eucommiae TaxID=1355755 RepID=A0ABS4J3P4_9BACL|nr:YafY family protein [Paenibacillus eucommiae]MBP1994463.1 putative DNA-binding transcriptional regulator YafY [Paenibacillus eucommiae]